MDIDTLFADAIAGDSNAIAELATIADQTSHYNGRTILHTACKDANIQRIEFILTELAYKNLLVNKDYNGQTALHLAAYGGYTKVVEILIDAARRYLPNSSATDEPHNSSLSGFKDFLRKTDYRGSTALHHAVYSGDVATVKVLVEADPNDRHTPGLDNYTPVFLAVRLRCNDIVKTICETCTAPSLDGPRGTTALHLAISKFHEAKEIDKDVFMVLMESAKHSSLLEDAPHNNFEAFFNKTDDQNETLLSLAVVNNYLDMVELILKEDPAYERVPGSRNNDLKSSILIASRKGYKEICTILCTKYEAGKSDHAGHIVLIDAIRGGDKELVYALLEYDKYLARYKTSEKWTALHYAVFYGFNTVIAAIIKATDELYYDNVGTPLILAANKGFTSTVILLMELLSDSSSMDVDHKGQNILHIAAVQSNKVIIQSILAYCRYTEHIVNSRDDNGNTPLHLLISNGCFVPELIKHKSIQTPAKNNDNWTPYEMLYFQEEIVADQVKIKKLLDDDIQAAQHKNFWGINVEGTSNNLESCVPSSVRLLKDIEFRIRTNEMMERENDHMKEQVKPYRERTGVQIVVTALITTVTFTVGFTMPGGYHQSGEPEEGLVLLSKKKAFQVFMVSDALALALSITSLFIYFISSLYDDPHQVSKFDAAATGLNIVSVMAMILTFIAGIYVVLSDLPGLALTVCIICSTFFISIIVLLIKLIFDRKTRKKIKV